MIFISSTSLKKETKRILKFFVLSFKQIFWFSILNRKRILKNRSIKVQKNESTLFFSNSNALFRSWYVYQIVTNVSRIIKYKPSFQKGTFINILSIIFPKGISNISSLDLKIVMGNAKNIHEDKIENISFSKKQLAYYRDHNSIELEIKDNVKAIEAKSKKGKIALQIFANIFDPRIVKKRTIFLVVDAVSFKEFKESKVYCEFLSESKHVLKECFSPSTVTGSALPSLLTLKPFFTHLMGDYNAMYYSPDLECLSPNINTLAEVITSKVDYKSAITSFSKTMPFYGYYRGFDRYYNRCSGNNYSPSALDIYKAELIEKKAFLNNFNSQFNFIHDIGGHPPVIPNLLRDNQKLIHFKNSYSYSINVSLEKVKDIMLYLNDSGELLNTNLIITGDHTESYGFSKNKYNLFPERISVPLFFRPSEMEINSKLLNWLDSQEIYTPLTFLLSKIFSDLFEFNFNHPHFIFNELFWLSSVFEYPKRKYIYTLALSNIDKKYYCCKIKLNDILEINDAKLYKSLNVEIFSVSSKNNLKIIDYGSKTYKWIKESFISYLYSCRISNFRPIKQGKL